MTNTEIITALIIHLLVPAAGVAAYLFLYHKLLAKGASFLFLAQLFLLFFCYGGILLILLTSLFWTWSGMASLGTFYLMLAAPVLMFPVMLSLRKQQNQSSTHRIAFRASLTYYLFPILCVLAALIGR